MAYNDRIIPLPPSKENKELMEIIEQTKREIAQVFRVKPEHLGKQRRIIKGVN